MSAFVRILAETRCIQVNQVGTIHVHSRCFEDFLELDRKRIINFGLASHFLK